MAGSIGSTDVTQVRIEGVNRGADGALPPVAILAALGDTLLQVAAIVFHAARREYSGLPLNRVLLAFAVFIFRGRSKWVLVLPRG